MEIEVTSDVVILAGGHGTRLASDWSGPKCLAPVGGRPFIAWVLEGLERQGFRRAILALGVGSVEVTLEVEKHKPHGMAIEYSVDTVSGTDNAVEVALALTRSRDVVVVNGDTLVWWSAREVLNEHVKGKFFATTQVDDMSTGVAVHTGINIHRASALKGPKQIVRGRYPFIDIGTPSGLRAVRDRASQGRLW